MLFNQEKEKKSEQEAILYAKLNLKLFYLVKVSCIKSLHGYDLSIINGLSRNSGLILIFTNSLYMIASKYKIQG